MSTVPAVFAPVSPIWRGSKEIELDLVASGTGPTEGSRLASAEVERLVRQGDVLFRLRKYPAALASYKEARARIFALITPRFDIGGYVRRTEDVVLPLTRAIESQLHQAEVTLLGGLRPVAADPTVLSGVAGSGTTLPSPLGGLLHAGIHTLRSGPADGIAVTGGTTPAGRTAAGTVAARGTAAVGTAATHASTAAAGVAAIRPGTLASPVVAVRPELFGRVGELLRPEAVVSGAPVREVAGSWKLGVPAGQSTVVFSVKDGALPEPAEVEQKLYQSRVDLTDIRDLYIPIADTSSTTLRLTHLYAYVLVLKIGDCYHALGNYAQAEANFVQAAGYSALNRTIEATVVWLRLAENLLEWATSLYQEERFDQAQEQLSRIVTGDGAVPGSVLYDTAALKVPAEEARTLIGGLSADPLPEVNPAVSRVVLEAYGLLSNLLAGFDYYGLLLSPIHTFEYLQQVTRSFCQQAIQAEREFVNFKSRQELEAASRRELANAVTMAEAEAQARRELMLAAQADAAAAQRGVDLARKRRADATAERDAYASVSATQIWAQAASQAQLGGSDSWYSEVSELADKLARGESIKGERGKLAAAYTLHAGRRTRKYELARMQHTIDQLTAAIGVAEQQRDAANARARATAIAYQASLQQIGMAKAALTAFDSELFTPDAWERMAGVMRWIARSHLERAIRVAKLMERAYRFETDEELQVVKSDYGFGIANDAPGQDTRLLGGDALLVDVEAFTYHAITTTTRKVTRIKDVVSLAQDYPAQFEAFLATGLLSLETDLYEFERRHPGCYAQRIETVEIEVVGLLGDRPLSGTLTGGGWTSFRRRDGSLGSRVAVVDTLALSDFTLRDDLFLYPADPKVRGLFQGLGLGGTWQLHLPRRSNPVDLRRIFDIRLVFYYTARFDPALRTEVLARPLRPDELARQQSWSLRFDFPAAWYGFYAGGTATFALTPEQLPANERDFVVSDLRLRVRTRDGAAPGGIALAVTGPDGTVLTATTDPQGLVSAGTGLAGLVGDDPLGEWTVAVTGGLPDNAAGEPDRDRVYDIQLSLDYTFEYLDEVL